MYKEQGGKSDKASDKCNVEKMQDNFDGPEKLY